MSHRRAAASGFSASRPAPQARDVKDILKRREAMMREAARLREYNASSLFVAKIQQLLTRWWAPASWQAREELLKTADWLISLEKRSGRGLRPADETRA
ncbi:MAG TPA: hypothetical protein VM867_09065 [Xanthobacteraceae bacterium]|nr:hypothetical protein [Xanthobacteraceae bacterium]